MVLLFPLLVTFLSEKEFVIEVSSVQFSSVQQPYARQNNKQELNKQKRKQNKLGCLP